MLQQNPRIAYKAKHVREFINEVHNTNLSSQRIRQILEALVKRKRIVKKSQKNPEHQSNNVYTYQFVESANILIGSSAWKIFETFHKIDQRNEEEE